MNALSFACPECSRPELAIARRLVLPGDRRSDEIALEIAACACGFKCIAVTEHLKRMNIRDASSEHIGFRLPGAAVDLLAYLIARCPEPDEEFCSCPAHAVLNRRDLRNQWNLLQSFAPFTGFALPAPGAARAEAPAIAYAALAWVRDGEDYRAEIDGREWRLRPPALPAETAYELSIDGALGLEIDAWPPFWRAPQSEQK